VKFLGVLPADIKKYDLCFQCHEKELVLSEKTASLTNFRDGDENLHFIHVNRESKGRSCKSCHNVHGSTNVRLLKAGTTIDESCTSCHAEKRGPYLWEHAPVSESCVTCHEPHGSNNERLLVSKLPFLCQRCHVTSRHPPTVYEGFVLQNSQNANKIYSRACTACHTQVHGSNAPSGKALLR